MKRQRDGSAALVAELAVQLAGPKSPASVISAVFPSTCRRLVVAPTCRLHFNTNSSREGVGASPSPPPASSPRSLKDVSVITSYPLAPRPLVPPPPSAAATPSPPALCRPPTPSTGAPRRVKHGALYSRKGACPHRTSGPFNGRPQAGIRPPLLGLRRVLQHRHANISSGRPKWKTQTRNIEISSVRAREQARERAREADSGEKK